ncbi:MAG: FAD-binding oxidoreductase [Proteobacteria bacterium]|nr:FAD-binding oxidoreductase [Burkholderiales bacterium]
MKPYDPIFADTPGTGLGYPGSYWTATSGPVPADDGVAPVAVDTDIAVIGGGYTGLSTAYHLARRYGRQVTVLEANRPGWGCSGRNGGFARMAFGRLSFSDMVGRFGRDGARRLFGSTMASLDNVREMIGDGAIDCDASEAGHLKIAPKASRAGALEAEAEVMRRELEYPAEYLPAAQLQRDHVGGTQSHGALRIPDALAVHPLKLSLGVLRMARAAGAAVHSSSPVTAWQKNGATHRLTTPHGIVNAREVVIATNGYTPTALHPELRATLFPILSHIIVTRPMTDAEIAGSNFITGHVMTDVRKLMFYWRRLPDRRILFGGRGLIADTPWRNANHRDYLLRELIAKYPALDGITVDYDWHGWVCFTRDFLPRIRRATDDPTVHYAVGYQGSGVSLSLYAGRLLAAQIADDAGEAGIDAARLPLARFPAHALLRIPQRAMFYWYRFLDSRG